MSETNVVLVKVRAHLREMNIKLWLEPYYTSGAGVIEVELNKLSTDVSGKLNIPWAECVQVLKELQESALRKLVHQKEFNESGIATLTVRRVNTEQGTQVFEVKCELNDLGSALQSSIAKELNLTQAQQVKCIAAGKIIDPNVVLQVQGVRNNQHVLVIVSELDGSDANTQDKLYDRIRKIKEDVERIVDSKRQMFEMEDQDGNLVFMPPEENRALLMALGFCEKARVAMRREKYDEALILLLEADEKFNICSSKFLESVDNYALVNLDIVWCYLLLKNVSQLPDAERRLNICENSFKRTYGPNMERARAIKGSAASAERALMVRLHLLQGVINFHKNLPNQAWEKLEMAAQGLRDLKVNEDAYKMLIEMGYKSFEVRLALRDCSNNVERAIHYIHEQREKKEETKKKSRKERHVSRLTNTKEMADNWINPRSICKLMEMGYEHGVVVEALKLSKNSLSGALDLLQTSLDELRQNVPLPQTVNNDLLNQLIALGFPEKICEAALLEANNNLDESVDYLVKMMSDENELAKILSRLDQLPCLDSNDELPSTSQNLTKCSVANKVLSMVNTELESLKAYQRFNEDMEGSAHEYTDLPLVHEEQILIEYQNLLER